MLWNPMSALRVCDREAVFLRAAHTRTLPPAGMPDDTANFLMHLHTSSVPCRCKWEGRRRDKWRKRRRERKRRAAQHRLSHKHLWRSTRRPFTGNSLWRVFEERVCGLMCKWCVCWLSDTPCSLCWRCSLRNASNPLRARSAWPRPASMWISRTLCETRRKKARLSSVRTPIWTVW